MGQQNGTKKATFEVLAPTPEGVKTLNGGELAQKGTISTNVWPYG